MNRITTWKVLLVAVAVSLLSLKAPAWAGENHGHEKTKELNGGILEQLLEPCFSASRV